MSTQQVLRGDEALSAIVGEDDYDWLEAFGYAGEAGTFAGKGNAPDPALPGVDVPLDGFARADVTEVAAALAGENEGEPWRIYGRLRDGRWFYIEAGCDYTGWD